MVCRTSPDGQVWFALYARIVPADKSSICPIDKCARDKVRITAPTVPTWQDGPTPIRGVSNRGVP